MSSDAIEGEPSHLEAIPILSPSMPTLDVPTEPISYALKSHDDPRIPLKHPKQRSHEDHKEDQEEQQQWLENIKNSYAVEWMDKDKALRVEPKPDLDPKDELKLISLINITHPSLEWP